MDNKSVSIEHGLPEPNVLLVIFRLNPDQYQLPFMLAFFNGQKFVIYLTPPSFQHDGIVEN